MVVHSLAVWFGSFLNSGGAQRLHENNISGTCASSFFIFSLEEGSGWVSSIVML